MTDTTTPKPTLMTPDRYLFGRETERAELRSTIIRLASEIGELKVELEEWRARAERAEAAVAMVTP